MNDFVAPLAFQRLERLSESRRQIVVEKEFQAAARKSDSYSIATLTERSSTMYQLATRAIAASSSGCWGSSGLWPRRLVDVGFDPFLTLPLRALTVSAT